MNYFELFDIPVSLSVNRALLAKKYVELQRRYHPDFYTLADEDEQQESLEKSTLINKALKVLQQPDQTIQYVLQIKGMLIENEQYKLPPGFLVEMMELNENLATDDPETFKQQISALEQDIYEDVKNIVENYADETVTAENLLEIKEYYFKKKYLQRILDRLDD